MRSSHSLTAASVLVGLTASPTPAQDGRLVDAYDVAFNHPRNVDRSWTVFCISANEASARGTLNSIETQWRNSDESQTIRQADRRRPMQRHRRNTCGQNRCRARHKDGENGACFYYDCAGERSEIQDPGQKCCHRNEDHLAASSVFRRPDHSGLVSFYIHTDALVSVFGIGLKRTNFACGDVVIPIPDKLRPYPHALPVACKNFVKMPSLYARPIRVHSCCCRA